MTADTYQLRSTDTLLRHGSRLPKLLRDHPDDSDYLEIEALVASGDCLITLATELDGLNLTQHVAHPQVEKVIRTLLYLQRHYKLARKPSEHRQ
ncbi:MAG: hypothetical protein WA843_04305 [Candidatus Saccharimonadales bacterium]